MLVGLVSVPLVLSYVGKDLFGFWAAITSFVTWVSLFDFGLVNGLVNVISEANGRDDRRTAQACVSTAFFILATIMVVGIVAVLILAPTVGWAQAFGVSGRLDSSYVKWCVLAALLPILAGLPLSIVRQIYTGYQKAYLGNIFMILGSIATLGGMYASLKVGLSLPWLILVFTGCNIVFVLFNFCYLVIWEMPWLKPGFRYISRPAIRRLMASSTPIFLYQIGALLVNNSQPMVMLHYTNLTTVADYSIIIKLQVVLSGVLLWSTNSFIPTFREARERGDFAWMRLSFRRMVTLRMVLAILVSLVLFVLGNRLITLWLRQNSVHFGSAVWLAMSISIIGAAWVSAYGDFLTVMDIIWVQVVMVILNGLGTAIFTILLAPRFGVLGAIIAVSLVNVAIISWVVPLIAKPVLWADLRMKERVNL